MDERHLTAVVATPDTFAPYGTVIAPCQDAPAGALDLSGGTPRLWVMTLHDRTPVFDHITRHRRVTQCLASADAAPWLLAVAAPSGDGPPGPVSAFVVPGATALLLHRGTWHAGPFFSGTTMRFFNLEHTDTNDTDHDTVALPGPHRIDIVVEVPATTTSVRRVLVVANRTADSPQLLASLRRLAASGTGTTAFRVLVPVTNPTAGVQAIAAADPMVGLMALASADLPMSDKAAAKDAYLRLDGLLAALRALGVEAEGEVGVSDPMEAIAAVLARRPVDEILLSTLPAGLSKWLSRDLPTRCARRFGLPVTHVEAAEAGA